MAPKITPARPINAAELYQELGAKLAAIWPAIGPVRLRSNFSHSYALRTGKLIYTILCNIHYRLTYGICRYLFLGQLFATYYIFFLLS